MNTNPDEQSLALWLDDELAGEDLAAIEAWAEHRPEQLAARQQVREWRAMVAAAVPAAEEPPFPEFFNSRIQQAIQNFSLPPEPAVRRHVSWSSWLMPVAACVGMVLTFWAGTKAQPAAPDFDVAGAPKAIIVEPALYTPENGVDAEWFASVKASATVIVLNGVAAIPDSTDFSPTVEIPMEREIDSTAGGAANSGTDNSR